jgi:hypothetical protein
MVLDQQGASNLEQRVRQAAISGQVVDLRAGNPDEDDPALGATWTDARMVPADLLLELLTAKTGERRPRAVKLRGVRISGSLDLEAATLVCPLLLHGCYLEQPLNLQDAQGLAVRLPGCHLSGIAANHLETRGNLELTYGFTARGQVNLVGAHIGGIFNCDGGHFINPEGYALDAANLIVALSMFCGEGFTAQGEVRLLGGSIGGQFNCSESHFTNPSGDALNAQGLTVGRDMFCVGLVARGAVALDGAHIGGQLECTGTHFTNPGGDALNALKLTVDQGMTCTEGFTAEGAVRLDGAHIGGQFNCSESHFTNPGGDALSAVRLTAEHGMFCTEGFTAEGEVRLVGAHIGGQMGFYDATIANPDGEALNAQGLTVEQALLCREFAVQGEVSLTGAHIREVSFNGGQLTNPDGDALSADSLTVEQNMLCHGLAARGEVSMTGAHIGGQLVFQGGELANPGGVALMLQDASAAILVLEPRERPIGAVDLTNARVDTLVDHPATWPEQLRLVGFVYQVLMNDEVGARARCRDWLRRDSSGYSPQPYEQLAATYRRAGDEQSARQVAVAKQWRRRGVLSPLGKVWNWLLYATVGYGYRTWLAGLWLVALLWIGTRVLDHAYHLQLLTPARDNPSQQPTFRPVALALDLLLPIVNLGQQDAWLPHGWVELWVWGLTLAGWVLTTAVIAGLTGVLKRD